MEKRRKRKRSRMTMEERRRRIIGRQRRRVGGVGERQRRRGCVEKEEEEHLREAALPPLPTGLKVLRCAGVSAHHTQQEEASILSIRIVIVTQAVVFIISINIIIFLYLENN